MKKIFPALMALLTCHEVLAQNTAYPDTVFTNYFRRETGWNAGDATISIPLPDDRVLWLFGDSHIDSYNPVDTSLPCMFQVRNAAMVQDKNNPNQMTTLLDYAQQGNNQTLFKLSTPEPAHTFFWPGHGYAYGDTVFIFLNRYHHPPGGSSTFLGTYLAKMTLPDLQIAGIYPLPAMDGIIFGRWVFVPVNSQYFFVYGNKIHQVPFGDITLSIWKPYVARVPLNNPLGQWQYRTANAWTLHPTQAAPISNYGVSPGFSVVRRNGDLYLITQQNGYLQCGAGRNIDVIKGGVAPWDPFNGAKYTVYTVPDQYNGHYLSTYNAYIHPEWNHTSGLLISYNVNDPSDTSKFKNCPFQCFYGNKRNADTYRPKFIRLPWTVLTGGNNLAGNAGKNEQSVERASEANLDALAVSCYPNPATSILQIVVANANREICQVQIIDLTGRAIIVHEQELIAHEHHFSLDIAALTPGIYILQVQVQNEKRHLKIAVER